MKNNYILIKDTKSNKNFHMTYDKINGFKLKPKKDLKYDGVKVEKMVLINPTFIEKLIKKKVKHKLDMYLQYLITVLDDDYTEIAFKYVDGKKLKSKNFLLDHNWNLIWRPERKENILKTHIQINRYYI